MSDTLRAALANLLAHAERANEIMLHEAGIGVIDLNALHAARAALASPQAEPVQAQPVADERAACIAWLSETYPHAWSEEDAAHAWDHDHVFALAWKERARLASRPQAEQAQGERG